MGKGFTVKISDVAVYRTLFARDYYYIDGRGSLPVRWMAPETLLWVSFLCPIFSSLLFFYLFLYLSIYPSFTHGKIELTNANVIVYLCVYRRSGQVVVTFGVLASLYGN